MCFAKKYWITEEHRWNLHVTPQMLVAVSIFIITLPIVWLSAWFVAVSVHEMCHLIAVYLCGKHIYRVSIDVCGAKIETEPLTNGQTLLCTLAGPVGGLLLLPFRCYYPQLAICAFVQSIFNLLPIYPLDGGRILSTMLQMVFQEKVAEKISDIIAFVVVLLLSLFFAVISFLLKTIFPMAIILMILLQQGRK